MAAGTIAAGAPELAEDATQSAAGTVPVDTSAAPTPAAASAPEEEGARSEQAAVGGGGDAAQTPAIVMPAAGGAQDPPAAGYRSADSAKVAAIGPPESLEPGTIYKLYRGATAERPEHADQHLRIWVEFPALQLCWASYDLPARPFDRVSLLDLSFCKCGMFTHDGSGEADSQWTRLEILADVSVGTSGGPTLSVIGPPGALGEFGEALQQLIKSRDKEGQRGLEFIQKRLFQYLWKHQGQTRSREEHYEAQAVLAFNLEPKEGVAYLKSKLNKRDDQEIGEWIAQMATQKGGLDPTLLGNYFSRRDTLEIFRAFVRCLDFRCIDIVVALRKLFDTFKPGGEGQVITRILEYFAEAYFDQWLECRDETQPRVAYEKADSVCCVAVSLIMLNTGLHVATKKVGKRAPSAAMTVEQYIANTRGVVPDEEVPEQALRVWYDAVKDDEISVEPLPRAAFSKLPVQPDIEGWLIAVLGSQTQQRCWAVLALQRMYLFSDANEVEPADAIDLKDVTVRCVAEDGASKERFSADLQRSSRGKLCQCFPPRDTSTFGDLQDAETRAFEVCQQGADKPAMLQKLSKPRTRLALVAETADLMEKWVGLIAAGPY